MKALAVEAKVIDIDLRERYDDLLAFGSFTDVQRAFADSYGLSEADLTRVLVIDDSRDLESHARGFERIVKAPGVKRVICLAVGPALDDAADGTEALLYGGSGARPRRTAVRRPFELASHATLWVGDSRGIGWSLGNHQPDVIVTGPSPASSPMFDSLVDALLSPRVFDRVYEAVRTMPGAVASPGLRVMIGQVDDDVLADARARAIDRILASHQADDGARPASDLVPEPFRLLLRYPRVADAGNPILASGGEMAGIVATCRDLVTDGSAALNFVTSPGVALQNLRVPRTGAHHGQGLRFSQAGLIAAATRQVGARTLWLRDELLRLMEEHDSLHPLGTTAQEELRARGFALAPPAGMGRADLLAALRKMVDAALTSRRPVAEVTGWLRWMHEFLLPRGSAARCEELVGACPTDRLEFLRDMPRRLAVNLTAMLAVLPVLIGAGLVAAAAGSVSGNLGAWLGTAAVALVAVRGYPLVVARRMTPLVDHQASDVVFLVLLALLGAAGAFGLFAVGRGDPGGYLPMAVGMAALALACILGWWLLLGRASGPPGESPVDLLGLVVTAVAGAHVGLALGTTESLDDFFSVPVQLAAGALALAALAWWPHLVWTRAVRAWGPAQYVELARETSEAVARIMEDVARYDWSLTGPRRAGADLVRAMSLAFEDVTAVLGTYSDRLRGFPAQPPRQRRPGADTDVALRLRAMGTPISNVVEADVIDLIASVVERCWPDIEREALDALSSRVRGETGFGLDRYDRHLSRTGVHAPPPFRTDDADREKIVDAAWQESERLGVLLRTSVSDGGLMQLCAPEHLQLLDVDTSGASAVRFAPRAARSSLVSRGSDSKPVAGTPSGPLPPEVLAELEWTDWGQTAGVLRLVRMRSGTVETVLKEGS
ncbi:hypothetical protein [Parafrankia elaeagni]|uniref:hypothetical protein n=1 Tax=Parafrankia elaeagni TaxID=222534 RepID=UPI00035C5164|nr:hypothetical protein [Parafrankia elaeagni]